MTSKCKLAKRVEDQLLERNLTCEEFFAREALGLAQACREMSERSLRGGRRLAFGRMQNLAGAQRAVAVLVEDGRAVEIGWHGRSCIVG